MDPEFWHTRWESEQLGFHQTEANALLREHWPRLDLAPEAGVFVPLCGKSLDMHWLRERGHPVLGVELSPIAIQNFFAEAGLECERRRRGPFEVSSSAGLELFCGDFFDLTKADLDGVRAFYDRACLIALPPAMRERYAAHLKAILPREVTGLLVTVEYDQASMDGPPHSVTPAEVEQLFGDEFEIETLWQSGEVPPPPPVPERGIETWCETLSRLRRG